MIRVPDLRRFPFLCLLAATLLLGVQAGIYPLPGTCDTSAGVYPKGDPRNGLKAMARDSNGFWYVVWENASQTDIVLAYSTTSTPLNTGGWALVTLVDNAGGGVIAANPANDTSGNYPSICMGLDDVLHFVWRAANASGTCYYATCTTAANAATAGNWSTPLLVSTDITDFSFALDYLGTPHLAGRGVTAQDLLYTKYDTATTAWLAPKTLSTVLANSTVAADSVNLCTDLDNRVYVAWRPDVTSTSNVYLLASSDAYAVAPASSTWLNLARTTATPDTPATDSIGGAPGIGVSNDGFLSFVYVYSVSNGTNRQRNMNMFGVTPPGGGTGSGGAGSLSRCLMPMGQGNTLNLFWRTATTDIWRSDYATATNTYRLRPSGALTGIMATSVSALHVLMSPARLPRDIDDYLWFGFDATGQRIITSDSAWTGQTGWSPPSQSARKPHPHLNYVFPNTKVTLPGTAPPPAIAHTSKSAVYVSDGSSYLYAVDSSTGAYARSYSLTSTFAKYIATATYSGNVHLYLATNNCRVLALIDDGSTISPDPNWGNNPKLVGNATGNVLHSLAFYSESSARYLYMMASVNTTHIGVNKISADNGNDVTGFPAGTAYSPNALESLVRVINDNVYVAGNTSQVYRRGADGSGEIFSSGITNAVRHLMLWRNSNDLYVSPDGNYVYRLTSGLLTNTWTSGQSASPGTVKTSGVQMNPNKTFLFMGVGNQLYKVNTTDGGLISNTPMSTLGNIVTLPFQWKSYVYFGTDTGSLYAVNATDPTVARGNWPVSLPSAPIVTLMVADGAAGVVYVVANKRIYRFSLE